eukprot:c49660_g1_i1 orf=86-427(+)
MAWVSILEERPVVDPYMDDEFRISHFYSFAQGTLGCRTTKKRGMKISRGLDILMKKRVCFARFLEKFALRSWGAVKSSRCILTVKNQDGDQEARAAMVKKLTRGLPNHEKYWK